MEPPANHDRRQKHRRGGREHTARHEGPSTGDPASGTGATGGHGTGPAHDAAGSWGSFQDQLDDAVAGLDEGRCIDLATTGAPWRIRIRAGWPGVEGPGTLAYHLQLGSEMNGTFGPWATTPFARNLGFAATRVAGVVAALGVASDATGLANPSMISSGAVGALEMSDLAVELLREAFGVTRACEVNVIDPDAEAHAEPAEGSDGGSPEGHFEHWWHEIDFRPLPEVGPDGEQVVGWIGNVLVELNRDLRSLPGLTVIVARARLTDPAAEPLAGPSTGVSGLLGRLRIAGSTGVTVEAVGSRDQLVHAWAHRMMVTESPAAPGDIVGAAAAAEAAAQVVRFVRTARRADPDVSRPARMILRMGD